jgi:Surface-adhesin protein E
MFLIVLAITLAAPAERWVRIGGSANLYEEFLDKESVTRTGDKVTLWTRRDFARGGGIVWHEIEIDCARKEAAIVAFIRDDAGIVSHNDARPYKAASTISPGSVEEELFNLACGSNSKTEEV